MREANDLRLLEIGPAMAAIAVIAGAIASTRGPKAEAVQAVAAALDGLTADLGAMGGVALGVDTLRRPLAWSAHSAATRVEHARDKRTGQY